jgi:uncharacterized protein YegP (UPF0339 family)
VPGKFVLKRGTTGKFRFKLLSTNGKVLATSEPYESKAAALRGVESVRKNAGARLEDQTENTAAGGSTRRAGKKDKVVKALARDWEQTKADVPGLSGKNLRQNIDDTVKQAAGKESTPPKRKPNRAR